jgi:hypothetical protein
VLIREGGECELAHVYRLVSRVRAYVRPAKVGLD